jgi:hypothetical protein
MLAFYLFSSCTATRQASNLANCNFTIRSVENITLAGVGLGNANNISDLTFTEAAMIMAGIAGTSLPLSLDVEMEGQNPNSKPAGVNRVDWKLFVDDIEITNGSLDQPIMIPASGRTNFSVPVNVDLKRVLSGTSAEVMVNFAMNLGGGGKTPSRIVVKLKPTIVVGGVALKYPGYISVSTKYGK